MSSTCHAEYRVNTAGNTVRRTPTEMKTLRTHREAWAVGWDLESLEKLDPEQQTIILHGGEAGRKLTEQIRAQRAIEFMEGLLDQHTHNLTRPRFKQEGL